MRKTLTPPLRFLLRRSLLILVGPFLSSGVVTAAHAQTPTVIILTTGGTIASAPGGSLPGGQVVAAVPELLNYARIEVEEVYRIGSSQMVPENWLVLARRINEIFRGDPDLTGIVVTHGTDTLEETAFFLNLTVKDSRPVVVVGSMRTPDAISADGPANLLNAVRVAVSPAAADKGVLVVLNEDIGAARDIQKTHNQRVETFRSPGSGFLGVVDPDRVVFYRESTVPHTTRSSFEIRPLKTLPTVPMVVDYTGADGSMLTSLLEQDPDGVVVGSFAGGRLSAGTRAGVQTLVDAGVPVVVASRVPGGRIVGDPVSSLGALQSSDLPPHKARILLMLALTQTREYEGLQRLLDRY